jgi:hypothetical protein
MTLGANMAYVRGPPKFLHHVGKLQVDSPNGLIADTRSSIKLDFLNRDVVRDSLAIDLFYSRYPVFDGRRAGDAR